MTIEEYFKKYPEDICKEYPHLIEKSINLKTVFWNIKYAEFMPEYKEITNKMTDMIKAFNL